jgi:hypothetical protein
MISFLIVMGVIKAQLLNYSNIDLAHISLTLQWISFYAFLDFGIINWLSITKSKKTSFVIFRKNGLYASFSVAVFFTVFIAILIGSDVGLKSFLLIFIDVFLSYFIMANVVIMAKQEKYIKSFILHFISTLGLSIYLIQMLLRLTYLSFDDVLVVMILSKLTALIFLINVIKSTINSANFSKFIENIKYCKRYLLIQASSFCQYGSDIVIAYSLFQVAIYNSFSANFKVMSSSLILAGFITSYMVNYSSKFTKRTYSSLVLIFCIFIQCLCLFVIGEIMGVAVTFSMFIYVAINIYVSIRHTLLTINESGVFYRYFAYITLPILFIKYFSIKHYYIDGLAMTAIFQLSILVFYESYILSKETLQNPDNDNCMK